MQQLFATYLLTNWDRTLLYVGMTNNLPVRLIEHWIGNERSYTSRYNIYYLVWFQETKYIWNAIEEEKSIKKFTRAQKNELIQNFNPEWLFLNEEIVGNWPPTNEQMEMVKARCFNKNDTDK